MWTARKRCRRRSVIHPSRLGKAKRTVEQKRVRQGLQGPFVVGTISVSLVHQETRIRGSLGFDQSGNFLAFGACLSVESHLTVDVTKMDCSLELFACSQNARKVEKSICFGQFIHQYFHSRATHVSHRMPPAARASEADKAAERN